MIHGEAQVLSDILTPLTHTMLEIEASCSISQFKGWIPSDCVYLLAATRRMEIDTYTLAKAISNSRVFPIHQHTFHSRQPPSCRC